MPKHHQSLNDKQIQILKVIFKFRFVLVELVSKSGKKSEQNVVRNRLNLLVEQGYIYRRYDKSFRLQNRSAIYCLDKRGINKLKELGLHHRVLHAAYKDRSASEQFIEHNLVLLALYRQFRFVPGLSFTTKSELHHTDRFPKLLPDAFINFSEQSFFLDLIEQPNQIIGFKKKIANYSEWFEDVYDEWRGKIPKLLVICSSPHGEKSVQKMAMRYVDSDLEIYTTSLKTILGGNLTKNIWSAPEDPDDLVVLFGV